MSRRAVLLKHLVATCRTCQGVLTDPMTAKPVEYWLEEEVYYGPPDGCSVSCRRCGKANTLPNHEYMKKALRSAWGTYEEKDHGGESEPKA